LETRHAGDPYLLYNPKTKEFKETKVLGVLGQTGTQVDGTVLLPLREVQDGYDLAGKLTGVGVQLHDLSQEEEDLLRDRYNLEPELQVVTLSKVESTLRKATNSMREMIQILAWFLGLITGAVLLNTTLLRTLGQRRKLLSLRLSGISIWFIGGVAIVESLLLAGTGLGVGVAFAWLAQGQSGEFLAQYLPYVPSGQLIRMTPQLILGVMGIGAVLAVLATLPPLLWISKATHPNSLREG
jgi:ABC-type lipoprotein release transport system permease subunit